MTGSFHVGFGTFCVQPPSGLLGQWTELTTLFRSTPFRSSGSADRTHDPFATASDGESESLFSSQSFCLLRISHHCDGAERSETVVDQVREGDSGSLSLFCLQFMMSLTLFPPRPAKATVDLSPSSAAIYDVSYDSPFTALELSAMKPWLVSLAKESDCTMSLTLFTAMELGAVKPWLVKPASPCSAAIHVVSDAFPSTALELSALKP